jgi:hypothetical protein
VADDERGQLVGAGAQVPQSVVHAVRLLRERFAARVAEGRVGRLEAAKTVRVLGADLGERAPGPVAGVRLGEARVVPGDEPDAPADDGGGLAGAQQRTAPQRAQRDPRRRVGEGGRLFAAGLVERDREVALEATLGVVGRLPVAGQVDHPRGYRVWSAPTLTTTSASWPARLRVPWSSGCTAVRPTRITRATSRAARRWPSA